MIELEHKIEIVRRGVSEIDFFSDYSILWVFETDSTNDDLKLDWNKQAHANKILIADYQSAGRGQYDRVWQCQPGQSLMFSFSLVDFKNVFPLSLIVGLAIMAVIKDFFPKQHALWLKWPNDIWFDQRKLSGILCEGSICGIEHRIVVGVGLNMVSLPDKSIASASLSEFGFLPEKSLFLVQFFKFFSRLLRHTASELSQQWKIAAGNFWNNKFRFTCPGIPEFIACPIDLMVDGTLIVCDETGQSRKISSASLFPCF